MKTYAIEFDATEIAELISVCNAAIVSEEKSLVHLPEDSAAGQHCKTSIMNIKALKEKIKNAVKGF